MRFYLVLHGQTRADVQKQLCGGGWDIPLNEEGLSQARKLAKTFAKDKRGIRVIFSSPLLRCIQTTDVLHDVVKVKVRVISGLAERNLGLWERAGEERFSECHPWVEQVPGGESLNRFRARVRESFDFVLDNSVVAEGSPLIVTHAFFGATLLDLLSISDQVLEPCRLYAITRTQSKIWTLEAV